MKYLVIPAIVLLLTQLVKFVIFIVRNKPWMGNRFVWSFFWLGSFPSVHSATLASLVYLIGKDTGLSPVFGVAVIIALMLIYGLLEDKKRQQLFEKYFLESSDQSL